MKIQFRRDDEFFDLWSIVHLLSGILLGAVLFWLNIKFLPALVIAVLLFVGWEWFESAVKIIEKWPNVLSDIIFGLAGFFISVYFFVYLGQPFSTTTTI